MSRTAETLKGKSLERGFKMASSLAKGNHRMGSGQRRWRHEKKSTRWVKQRLTVTIHERRSAKLNSGHDSSVESCSLRSKRCVLTAAALATPFLGWPAPLLVPLVVGVESALGGGGPAGLSLSFLAGAVDANVVRAIRFVVGAAASLIWTAHLVSSAGADETTTRR